MKSKIVVCNMASAMGCTEDTCPHAVKHVYEVGVCSNFHCDEYDITAFCE